MNHDALRLVRVFHDLTRSEVAIKVGLSKSYITELEAGSKRVTLDVLEKYASAFQMPISSLLLFSEKAGEKNADRVVRTAIAGKVIKMLNWLAAISEYDDEGRVQHGAAKKKSAASGELSVSHHK